jgi:mxaK protein
VRRSRAHLLFGAAAMAFGSLAGYQGWSLQRAEQVNQAIAQAGAIDSALPEAALAQAAASATRGDYEGAVKQYKELARDDRADIRRVALYNLGNLHLRQGLKSGIATSLEALPLVELAKQSYRDLLREAPDDWDARYNLERALWLAPEVTQDSPEANRASDFERRVVRALPDFRLELP